MSKNRLPALIGLLLCFGAGRSHAAETAIDADTAVRRALGGNLSLKSATLEVERARHDVVAEEDRYPYIFGAEAGFTRSESPRLSVGDTVSSSISRSYVVGSSLRRTFASGTSAEVRVQGDRFENETQQGFSGTAVGSGYGMTGRVSVTQPLMRGAGTRVGEAELRAARISKALADKTRQRVTSEVIRDVLNAYWELWYAGQSVDIETAALKLARAQESEASERVKQGAIAPADVLTFTSRVAQLEENVVSARTSKQQRALDLARLMGALQTESQNLTASSAPPMTTQPITSKELEASLRSGSIELAEAEAQIKLARSRADVAGESSRARLDLDGYLQTEGVSTGIPKAMSRAAQMGWLTAHVGLTFEMPLSGSKGAAERANAILGIRIAENNVRVARDRITAEALGAVQDQRAAERRMQLAERTLDVAIKAHEAEKTRYELGQGLPITVQQAEDDVRRARLRVVRARVDLARAEIAVQHLSGALYSRWVRG
ncbi:MAG: TolC family protein [Polyangiaceae bacterium]